MWLLTVCSIIATSPYFKNIQSEIMSRISAIQSFKNEKAPSPPNVSSEWHEQVHHSYDRLPDHK